MIELITSKRKDALKLINMLLNFESSPYTQNSDSLAQERDKYLLRFKKFREEVLQRDLPLSASQATSAKLPTSGSGATTPKVKPAGTYLSCISTRWSC